MFESPLNKPTPTHAPNRGGAVACIGGPVDCIWSLQIVGDIFCFDLPSGFTRLLKVLWAISIVVWVIFG